ncbi:hypothetical protein [Paenibacillus aquistagni]|uniref:hypothetical protein n=1 Tax=Paenibacillus aquistagni TaxID=1852522 RepID=UPI000B505633|nr:hypothetical protein [Paenibacillus aquistagni]
MMKRWAWRRVLPAILLTCSFFLVVEQPALAGSRADMSHGKLTTAKITKSDKFSVQIEDKVVTAQIYIHKGSVYLPLRSLSDAFGYKLSYSKIDELDTFHHVEITGASKQVEVWGNQRWGYSIIQRMAAEPSPDDRAIYRPARTCKPETDNCSVLPDQYEGPLVIDHTLYVPVRQVAEALNAKLEIVKNNDRSVIHLYKRG